MSVEKLIQKGFGKVGSWRIEDGRPKAELDAAAGSREGVLYAFVSESTVMHIGMTGNTLKERIDWYRNPDESQVTHVRVYPKLVQLLEEGVDVDIYADPRDLATRRKDLFDEFRPPWNIR